ncbi:hypothetical protein GE061_013303 [Apolygus lucorum]|uniref:Uncharacterized protein n=1 Tax=Apolygus lucorum TaxID=248454 RepID=A0A8S9XMF6_APOLU|nr:hypothetical protein GE061_013303 [Apolygus lucorum]
MVHPLIKDMFPTTLSLGLFILYISLFVNQGWLVTASQNTNNSYSYSTAVAVLLAEILKLIASVFIYAFKYPVFGLLTELKNNSKVFALYLIPASLYCLYNNLSFVNLSRFDPTTYFVVLQLRVVVTGVIFQILFKKQLSQKQWLSLFLLTFGCMVKQINFGDVDETSVKETNKELSLSLTFYSIPLFAQLLCSCLAGVYNEYLLKTQGEVNVFVQNIFHNINSMICIGMVFAWQESFTWESLAPFMELKVFLVVCNNAAIGVVTSFFLKYLNSILKNFAGALELVFTAILSYFLFAIPIYLNTIVSICLILIATLMYSQNPVTNPKSKSNQKTGSLICSA